MGKIVNDILKLEEINNNPDDCPIEIEKIWTGRNNAYLFTSLFGKKSIFPYTK